MLSDDFHEDRWYNINGDEYKCLSIVNHVGIFMQFLGMCEKYSVKKFSLLKIVDDKFNITDDILPIYKYHEITRHNDLQIVWSLYSQDETYFMTES